MVALAISPPGQPSVLDLVLHMPDDGGKPHGNFHVEGLNGRGVGVTFSADRVQVWDTLDHDVPDYDPTWACPPEER